MQLADEAELLERSLELGAEDAPLDPLRRAECRLNCGSLAVAAEVRPQPRAQVSRPADVEHLVVAAAEEVDAGPGRSAEREVALVHQPAAPCRGERAEIRDRPRAALLCEPDEREEQLGGCARVGQRAMARARVGADEPRELPE